MKKQCQLLLITIIFLIYCARLHYQYHILEEPNPTLEKPKHALEEPNRALEKLDRAKR